MNDKWVHFGKDWFNLSDFCHIWIETRSFCSNEGIEPLIRVTGYYAMGEWRHNGEEVIITQDWESIDDLRLFLNQKLEVFYKAQRD